MANSKKKKSAKKTAKGKLPAAKAAPRPLRTKLMKEFFSRIKKPPPPGWQWPARGLDLNACLDEVLPVLKLLSKIGFGTAAEQAAEGAVPVVPGSLRDIVLASINASKWPTGEKDQYKLCGIAVLIDKMLQAANAHGGGGGPNGWPPH
jgi:hypothetical protein